MSKKKNNKGNYWILGVLLVIFFGILMYSTSDKNTSFSYEYSNYVNIESNDFDQTKIGTVKLTNKKMIPAKIPIKDLVGCTFENQIEQYTINHIGSRDKSKNYDLISGDYFSTYIEISSKSSQTLDLTINKGLRIKESDKDTENKSGEYTLHVFEIEDNKYGYIRYDICQDLRAEDSITSITLNFN